MQSGQSAACRVMVNALYLADIAHRSTNLAGACHVRMARPKLDDWQSYERGQGHIRSAAMLHGGAVARRLALPITACLDGLLGSGKTRRGNHVRDLPEAWRGLRGLNDPEAHAVRWAYLQERLAELRGGDMGVMGLLVGVDYLWRTALLSGLGGASGALLGGVGWLVARPLQLTRRKLTDVSGCAAVWGAAAGSSLAVLSMWWSFWLLLNKTRLCTALLKGMVSAVGCAIAGIGMGLRAAAQQLSAAPNHTSSPATPA